MKKVFSLILSITLPFLIFGQTEPINRIATSEIEYNVNESDPEDVEIVYKKGSKIPYSGIVFEKYENGKMGSEVHYKNGILDGLLTVWFENGNIAKEWNYSKGNPEGTYAEWYENGQKEQEGTNRNGKLEGLLTMWWENGQKKDERNYKNDDLSGIKTTWYENGQKESEGTYVGFKTLVGNYTGWYDNGQKWVEVVISEAGLSTEWEYRYSFMGGGVTISGVSDGLYTEWYYNGKKKKEITYANKVIVSEKNWDEKGNEVIK